MFLLILFKVFGKKTNNNSYYSYESFREEFYSLRYSIGIEMAVLLIRRMDLVSKTFIENIILINIQKMCIEFFFYKDSVFPLTSLTLIDINSLNL